MRQARRAHRAGRGGHLAEEQRQAAGGAVALDRHFIHQVRGGDAPVGLRVGMHVDDREDRLIRAGEALAGDGVHALLDRIFGEAAGGHLNRGALRVGVVAGRQLQVLHLCERHARDGQHDGRQHQRCDSDKLTQKKHLQQFVSRVASWHGTSLTS